MSRWERKEAEMSIRRRHPVEAQDPAQAPRDKGMGTFMVRSRDKYCPELTHTGTRKARWWSRANGRMGTIG
jgi:hypothetical protein